MAPVANTQDINAKQEDSLAKTFSVSSNLSNNPTAAADPAIYPAIDLKTISVPPAVLNKFPKDIAEKYQMVVFEAPTPNKIKIAVLEPENSATQEIINFIKTRNNLDTEVFRADKEGLDKILSQYSPKEEAVPKPEAQTTGIPPTKTAEKPGKPIKVEQKEEQRPASETKKPKEEVHVIKAEEIAAPQVTLPSTKEKIVSAIEIPEENQLDKVLGQKVETVNDLEEIIRGGFIPKILAGIIYLAVKKAASDIHIQSDGKSLVVRNRIDGILRDIVKMPPTLQAPLISRVKILSKLKIDEQRIPQDGRFDVKVDSREIDLRVSTLPTVHGEKVALRILDKSAKIYNFKELGLTGYNLKKVEENIAKPYGVIISTGPTGSGKTTTLYAILNRVSTTEVNIITLEDPVEYEVPGINQSQIKPNIGFGFAEGLRSILRQDPNIIMVGEVRDSETAGLVTHAALTGHLVLTTLHTNDAPSALPRLINMGVEPFLITSAINAVISQRLLRKVCPDCKENYSPPEEVKNEVMDELKKSKNNEVLKSAEGPFNFSRGKGCDACNHTGYLGRIGIYEVMEMTDKIENLAVNRAPASDLAKAALEEDMITMKQDGLMKAIQGITTIDEVLRVTTSE